MFPRKRKKQTTQRAKAPFEKAFAARLGQTPVEFIYTKLAAGSDRRSLEYLYDITAAEIARQNHCVAKPFTCFYPEAERMLQEQNKEQERRKERTWQQQEVQEKIKICQREFLNRKGSKPFGAQCEEQLLLIYGDKAFCDRITQISRENEEIEFCNDPQMPGFLKFKREVIPKRMKELGLTEHPMVQSICDQVAKSGKSQKSALITIYYAVRMNALTESKDY